MGVHFVVTAKKSRWLGWRYRSAALAKPGTSFVPVSDPPLRTRLCLATSSQRPATLTQQATLELIRQTLDALNAR